MLDRELIFDKLSTITDKFVEKAVYDDENRLNVTLKPEKNFRKNEIYEGFLNLTLIAMRLKDLVNEMESANEQKKEEEMHHTPNQTPPWTDEIQKTVKNASERIETQLEYYITSLEKKVNKLLPSQHVIEDLKISEEALVISDEKYNSDTFASILKKNLSQKLGSIPVSKATLNKNGNAMIVFPDEDSRDDAQYILEKDFNVSRVDYNHVKNWPKLKIHHIDPQIFNSDKNLLINLIKDKNEILDSDDIKDISVPFIDQANKFVILKVSPLTQAKIMKNQRLFIELQSFRVSDHFFALQCFKCQEFGHGANSTHCPLKEVEKNICLYCAKNHRSASCPSKKDKNSYNCANCLKSNVPGIKSNSNHCSTWGRCPILQNETENVQKRTIYCPLPSYVPTPDRPVNSLLTYTSIHADRLICPEDH